MWIGASSPRFGNSSPGWAMPKSASSKVEAPPALSGTMQSAAAVGSLGSGSTRALAQLVRPIGSGMRRHFPRENPMHLLMPGIIARPPLAHELHAPFEVDRPDLMPPARHRQA